MRAIKSINIHPAISIARLGNSPTGFFVGPEVPGVHPRPRGGYKDSHHRIKRPAARFRLFGYDNKGRLGRRLRPPTPESNGPFISPTEWKQFDGLSPDAPRRNDDVAGGQIGDDDPFDAVRDDPLAARKP
jgi:hypothetical protein